MPLFVEEIPVGECVQRVYGTVETDQSTTSVYPTYATLMTIPITTGPNNLRCFFTVCFDANSTANIVGYFRIQLDGVTVRGSSNRTVVALQGAYSAILCQRAVTAGSHTVTVQWATNTNQANIEAGGYANIRHAAILVEEVNA